MKTRLHPAAVAVTLIALFVGVTYAIPNRLYRRLPRLEDEVAGLWQARLYATGRIALPSPPAAEAFGVPYVLDIDGKRFSKYQPGHAAVLALGVLIGEPWIVNPLLFAVTLAVIYRFGTELFGARTGVLTVLLGATSPMLLMLSASLMQHAASILTASLALWGIFRLQGPERPGRTDRHSRPHFPARTYLTGVLSGLALGITFLIRPFTALLLGLPAAVAAAMAWRCCPRRTLGRYLPLGATFALVALILPLYNYLLIGKPAISLFTLWWAYDRPGLGPTVGPQGYYLADVLENVVLGLGSLNYDLHGWLFLSLAPVLAGLALKPRSRIDLHLAAYPAALFLGYLLLFHQSRLYGPRYYSEAIAPLVVLSARGIGKLFALATGGRKEPRSARGLMFQAALVILFASNLLFYLPLRFRLLQHLYDDALNWDVVDAARAASLHNAIIFVFADNWPGAAAGLLSNPVDLNGDVLYARYLSPDSFYEVQAAHPGRGLSFWRDGRLVPSSLPPPDWSPQCLSVCPPG